MTSKHEAKTARSLWRRLRLARRISQLLFLTVFLMLIGLTTSALSAYTVQLKASEMPYPVELFLNLDPLATLFVLLATGTVAGAMILSLITMASGFLFGRAFCGWVCPMGTMNHLVAKPKGKLKGARRRKANRTRPYQKIKYVVLLVVLGAALLGSSIGGLLDPLSLATRGIALSVMPWLTWISESAMAALYATESPGIQQATDSVHTVLSMFSSSRGGAVISGGLGATLLFAAVLAANRFVPRFWCRGLCPLGALLGLSGRFGILTLLKDQKACTDCGKCDLHCSGAASPHPDQPWQRAECDLCLNCVAVCNDNALRFGLSGYKTTEQSQPNLGRRTIVTSALAGAALVPAMRAGVSSAPGGRPDPQCIRPPGATDEKEFLERCIRCSQCMKICPTGALHPAVDEAGFEGFWTPVLVPKLGYCEPTCTLCTQVCPTGAIRTVSQAQKVGSNKTAMIRLGTAFFDRGRCLPWAMGTPCMVCEEFCPISPKAIWFEEKEVNVRGTMQKIKLPHVDPALCNGCGACEHMCPVHDKAAIRVTSAGESRAPKHALLLSPKDER